MLQATCQSNFNFLGKPRKGGEVISARELETALADGKTTWTAINSLKNQKLVVLSEEGVSSGNVVPLESASLHQKLDAIIAHFAITIPGAAVPTVEKPARKRRARADDKAAA